jgi:hypothetical protein
MSTVGEVVDHAGKLVHDVQELLATDTVKGVLQAASALGAQKALVDGFTALQGGLGQIDKGLTPVVSTLIGLDAFAGVLGIVPPVVDGIGLLISDSGDLFADLVPGLGDAKQIGEAGQEAMNTAGRAIGDVTRFVDDTLAYVDPASFQRLRADLVQLSASLVTLKQQASTPPQTG